MLVQAQSYERTFKHHRLNAFEPNYVLFRKWIEQYWIDLLPSVFELINMFMKHVVKCIQNNDKSFFQYGTNNLSIRLYVLPTRG